LKRILLTGATGFVGRAALPALSRLGEVVAVARRPVAGATRTELVADIADPRDWRPLLEGITDVVHLAARVHVMKDDETGEAASMRVNFEATRALAVASAEAGVGRFVFLSTIKVNGDTTADRPFTPSDPPHPVGAYAVSKHLAEEALAALPAGMERVILRPPLVYGPGVGGNFAALLRLCRTGLPLPLGAVANRRSLIAVENLASAIATCVAAPSATGVCRYLLRDGDDLSTAELVRRLAAAMGRPSRLVPVPPSWLAAALRIAGRAELAERLLASLQVDDSDFRRDYRWRPPVGVDAALAATARAFVAAESSSY
jgi:nucleoside-diphosphate-sugar epimerase